MEKNIDAMKYQIKWKKYKKAHLISSAKSDALRSMIYFASYSYCGWYSFSFINNTID